MPALLRSRELRRAYYLSLLYGRAIRSLGVVWLRGLDSNQRPLGYEPNELPGCSTPRHRLNNSKLS